MTTTAADRETGGGGGDRGPETGQGQHVLPVEYLWRTSFIHGILKIGAAPYGVLKVTRVLWLLCFLCMSCAMTYQLIRLSLTFFAFPVKTSVDLSFRCVPADTFVSDSRLLFERSADSPLMLPAVTVCNHNPIRKSQVHTLTCPLQALLKVDGTFASQECTEDNVTEAQDLCTWYKDDVCVGDPEDLDLFHRRRKKAQLKIIAENRTVIRDAGHQIEDLVISCYFDGATCYSQNVTMTVGEGWTLEYGNCYTLNTSSMKVFDSGAPSGLDLLMDLQTEELLTSFSAGYGVRVVLHEPGTRPFPVSQGFTLGAGLETEFALRLDEFTRLGGRYGSCKEDGPDVSRNPHDRYSKRGCRRECQERTELQRCGCTDALRRTSTPAPGVRVCTLDTELNCTDAIHQEYRQALVRGEDACFCVDPCWELEYRVRDSARKWPAPSHVPVLEETVCRLHHVAQSDVDQCLARKRNQTMEERTSSFVRLRLYYETLNYQRIIQEPFYDSERFLSDIGGTLGLWIGASLMGLGEVLEVLLFAVLCLWRHLRRCCGGLRPPVSSAASQTVGPEARYLDAAAAVAAAPTARAVNAHHVNVRVETVRL
ncbi:acid-sensing ion channel 1-like [Babylonia areolata]|uniref:acid-sensing ion channel 1-like n=1 Tax=Babylonia areolata TaxID=304850 RepID=UPI003FD0F319